MKDDAVPDLVGRLQRGAAAVFADQPVRFAYLFGSQATGRASTLSDIDVAVYVNENTDSDTRFALRLRLPTLLARAAAIDEFAEGELDVIVLNDVALRVQGQVLRDGRVIYSADEPSRVAYEVRTRGLAYDFEVFARPIDRAHLRAMARR